MVHLAREGAGGLKFRVNAWRKKHALNGLARRRFFQIFAEIHLAEAQTLLRRTEPTQTLCSKSKKRKRRAERGNSA